MYVVHKIELLKGSTTHFTNKVDIGLSILFTSGCVDEEIQTVLQPIQAEQCQVELRMLHGLVHDIDQRNRHDK